jgi:hypothetical protein
MFLHKGRLSPAIQLLAAAAAAAGVKRQQNFAVGRASVPLLGFVFMCFWCMLCACA